MSKRRNALDFQTTFQKIQDLIVTTKSRLEDERERNLVISDLHKIAELAVFLRENHPRSGKEWVNFSDELDAQGVSLWNISGQMKQETEDWLRYIAALRLAGFRLIEAGMESKPGPSTLRHVLQLSSKAGATFSELGNNEIANTVLTSAAEHEDALGRLKDVDDQQRMANACAIVVYHSARMWAAWKEGNAGVAEFMSQKILGSATFSSLPPRERENVAAKHLEIGKALLKTGSSQSQSQSQSNSRAPEAIYWLQSALKVTESIQESDIPAIERLRMLALRALARAYYLSSVNDPENLGRAEAALDELLSSIDASDDGDSDYQELRWQRLAVLKKRKADTASLLKVFKSIVDHLSFSESSVTDVLQELRLFSQHSLVTAVHLHCLEVALRSGHDYVDRFLLSLIMHCSKDEDHSKAMADLRMGLTSNVLFILDNFYSSVLALDSSNFDIQAIPAVACLTMLWKYGRVRYTAKKWTEAADWYLVGTHPIFQTAGASSASKCFRKAALCHIEHGEFATASVIMQKCSKEEASTHYVILIAAVRQGLQDEALKAVESMVEASDFNRKLLLAATRLSHEAHMRPLLLVTLEVLLKTLKFNKDEETVCDALTLIRCIIRLLLSNGNQPGNATSLSRHLLQHFQTAQTLIDAAVAQNAVATTIKDVNWLWRTAYNTAIVGCSEWENEEEEVAKLFEIAKHLMEASEKASTVGGDSNIPIHAVNASFSAISARIMSFRKSPPHASDQRRTRKLIDELRACAKMIEEATAKGKYTQDDSIKGRWESFNHILIVFEAELLASLKDWNQLSAVIAKATQTNSSATPTFGAIADILWAEKECPSHVLFGSLEAVLRASLDKNALSVPKFSRWLRALCVIVLAQGTAESRTKAIGYVEQALSVIEDNHEGEDAYPMDERQWLLGAAYNTGIECLRTSLLNEGRRWLEVATVMCRFVPNGSAQKEKISDTYAQLLARHSHV